MTALMGADAPSQGDVDTVEFELEEEFQPSGDVILARWLAVLFAATGLVALVASQGRWGLAGLLTAALALGYAKAVAWADRREASR